MITTTTMITSISTMPPTIGTTGDIAPTHVYLCTRVHRLCVVVSDVSAIKTPRKPLASGLIDGPVFHTIVSELPLLDTD
jgi:hypothetical protein